MKSFPCFQLIYLRVSADDKLTSRWIRLKTFRLWQSSHQSAGLVTMPCHSVRRKPAIYRKWRKNQRSCSHCTGHWTNSSAAVRYADVLHPFCLWTKSTAITVFVCWCRTVLIHQLSFFNVISSKPIQRGWIFHLLSCSSQKSRRPIRSIAAAEILAAKEALEEVLLLINALEIFQGTTLSPAILSNPKQIYKFLSSQRSSSDKSVRGAVTDIQF